MTDAFVLGGVRTPVGRYGGSLSHIRTHDLLGQAMVSACERVGVELERIEDIAAGCVNPAHEGMGDIARWPRAFPTRCRPRRSTASARRR
jgi:acetyl-CoA acetyltransferase